MIKLLLMDMDHNMGTGYLSAHVHCGWHMEVSVYVTDEYPMIFYITIQCISIQNNFVVGQAVSASENVDELTV